MAPQVESRKAKLLGPFYGPLRRVSQRLQTAREFRRDHQRYAQHSGWLEAELPDVLDGAHLEAQLTKDYHRVEKGLALREPKRPFGAEVMTRLQRHTPANGAEAHSAYARDAIAALDLWNSGEEVRGPAAIEPLRAPDLDPGVATAFFESRRSVRDFDTERVPTREELLAATELATHTPSVCNRQTGRVTYLSGDDARRALGLQNGNAGFRDCIPWVAVVTSDTRFFAGPGERNQPWVDGGLFAMTLVWALHAHGLSSCMLNWSQPNAVSDEARALIGIPEHEVIITFIAVGFAREGHLVARSPRRPVETVARFS